MSFAKNASNSSGRTLRTEEVALIVGLDGPGVVGIKLGLTQENIDGGSWGLLRTNLVIVAYPWWKMSLANNGI